MPLEEDGLVELPAVPDGCRHNAHMFYIKVRGLEQRTELIQFLKDRGIGTAFHYVPLHSSPAGRMRSVFHGEDRCTTKESSRLLRLPMYLGLPEDTPHVTEKLLREFFI